jgi:hypothetical protein
MKPTDLHYWSGEKIDYQNYFRFWVLDRNLNILQ